MLFDSLIRYGVLAGLAVAAALALCWLYAGPLAWLLLLFYCIIRANVPARGPQRDKDAWQRELAQMERAAAAGVAQEPFGSGSILPGERDEHMEALLAAEDFGRAHRYAREQAADALSRSDFERARVYEKYLDRIRRGGG